MSKVVKNKTKSVQAGLLLPVGKIEKQMKTRHCKRMGHSAAVVATASAEFLAVEIIKAASEFACKGKRARIKGVPMGGKTGTAEYGPKADRKKHAWMIAFAPFDRPRYALAVVIEDAGSGGMDAAPCVGRVMASLFGTVREGYETLEEDEVPL